jgi:hypothetical protein
MHQVAHASILADTPEGRFLSARPELPESLEEAKLKPPAQGKNQSPWA